MKKVPLLFFVFVFVFAFANALQANHSNHWVYFKSSVRAAFPHWGQRGQAKEKRSFEIHPNHSFFEGNFSLMDTCAAFNWPVAPADSCHNAPPFCADFLNGYCSINDGYSGYAPGNLSVAFGCPIENNQWLTFMPCESTVAFILSVDDCQNGNGLQFGIFQTNNCFGFNALTPCLEVADGMTETLTVNNLLPGETYYLMIDGQLADICHWQITGLQGAAGEAYLQEDITQGFIEGEGDICLGLDGPPSDAFMYSAVAPICNFIQIDTTCGGDPVPCVAAPQQFCEPHPDTLYDPIKWDTIWRIIPTPAGHFVNDDSIGMTVEVVWDSVGTFYLEAIIKAVEFDTIPFFNDCIDRCKRICPDPEGDNCIIERKEVNISIPDEFNFFFVKCPEECIPIQINNNGGSSFNIPQDTVAGGAGTIWFCSEGYFEFYVIDDGGCVDHYIVNINDFTPEDLYVTLEEECPGECVVYNGQTYCPGSYQIPYIDFNGCQATIFLEIIAAPDGNVSISGENEINCFNPTASLSAITDYNGSVDYIWSNGLNGQNIIVTSGGEYIVSVFAGNCLIGEAVFFVTEYFDEQFNLGTINLCSGDCFPLNGINYCDAGDYVEEFTDPNTGCTETYIFTIVLNFQPNFQIGPISEICDGINETYTIGFTILNGQPPYSVNGNFISGNFYQSNPIPTGDSYYFNVQSINNCGINEEIVSGFFDCPCITESGTMGLALLNQCEDEMVTPDFNNNEVLDPNDLLVFILHDNSGNSLGNIIGINATGVFGFVPGLMQYGETYYISPIAGNELNGSVDLSNNCLSVGAGQPVVFYEIPTLIPMPTQQLNCINTSEQLEMVIEGGSGIFVFQWDGPNGFSSNNASPIIGQGGTYTCTVIDEVSGCSVVESVFVEEDFATPQFDINSSGLITCTEPITTLHINGSPLNNYEWALPNGSVQSGNTISTDLAGAYSVIATATNGCTSENTFVQEEDTEAPFLQAGDTEINCTSPLATLSAFSGVPGVSFAWVLLNNDTMDGVSINTILPGTYSVIATAMNGCSSVEQAEVTIDTLSPQLELVGGEINCDHPSITLFGNSTTPGVIISWIFPTGNEVNGASTPTDIPGSYTVTATAPNGCTTSLQTLVESDVETPIFAVSSGSIDCTQTVDTLLAYSSMTDLTYAWLQPNGSQWAGDSIFAIQAGNYQVVATGMNGCTSTLTTEVVDNGIPPEFEISFGEINCLEPSTNLTATSTNSVNTYSWVFPNGNELSGENIITSLSGQYTVEVTAPNGCTATQSFEVIDNSDPPILAVVGDDIACNKPVALLLASANNPNVVFEWTLPNGSNATGPLLETELSGTYLVSATSLNGCVAEESLTVNEVAGPEFLLEMDWQPPACYENADGFIVISDVMGAAAPYTTMINGVTVSATNLYDLPAGDYQISIVDNNGCTGDTLITLTAPQEVIVELGNNVFAQLNEQVELSFQSNISPASILWSGPDGQLWEGVNNLVLLATKNGIYEVNIMDENGCSATDSIELFVSGQGEVFIPNAFSPNGDNQNDFLTVYAGNDVEQVKSFMVFDRWGNKVFDKENFPPNKPSMGWDGSYKNKKMDPQVFAFKAEVQFETGEIKIITGDALLIN